MQQKLTCVSVPWFPTADADSRFLINEIVVGEESDVDQHGNRKSHFELYQEAMQQCGAEVTMINDFLNILKETNDLEKSFVETGVPIEAQNFVRSTFAVIASDKAHLMSAVFTFGREDLIPKMFHSIVEDIHRKFPEQLSVYKYYLERHIEVDGEHHSHLAIQMISNLCLDSQLAWEEAQQAVMEALNRRIELWDGAYRELVAQKK